MFASTVRGPVDAANQYLDEARTGGTPAAACPTAAPVEPEVAASTGQHLDEVEVSGGLADVRGTLTRDDGDRVDVHVALERRGDGWCVVVVVPRGR